VSIQILRLFSKLQFDTIDMQNISESPESPATPPDIPLNIDFTPTMPFEQFRAEVDSLIMDILLHPQAEQLLSEFAQMLREIGILTGEPPANMQDHCTDADVETSFQAGTNGSLIVGRWQRPLLRPLS
jgi:hypothetical protein